jgi:hypothetical protein
MLGQGARMDAFDDRENPQKCRLGLTWPIFKKSMLMETSRRLTTLRLPAVRVECSAYPTQKQDADHSTAFLVRSLH